MSEAQEIAINEIKANTDFMMRMGLDKGLVAQYKENLDAILAGSPIEVYRVDGQYLLTDGFHRTAAARQLNKDTILAIVREGSFNDAYAAACLANLQHGKPLTQQERKKAICEYIKLRVGMSNPFIAKDVGMSKEAIRRYRRELEADGEIEPQEKRAGLDGKEQPTERTSIISGGTFVPPEDVGDIDEIPEVDPFEEWFNDRVVCDDALEITPTLERKFDLAIIDPPYGITTEDWDLTNKHELLTFTRRWLNQILQLLKPTARLYIFWSREYVFELKPLLDEIIEAYPLHFGGIIVWHFKNIQSMPDSRKRYKLGWEPIFYYYGLEAPELNFQKTKEITGEEWEGEVQSDVWSFAIPQSNFKDKRVHPTQKPLGLYKRIIETATHVGDAVIDPFAGSGTTGHAALLTGREFLLVEENPEYVQLISDRLKPIWSNPGLQGQI